MIDQQKVPIYEVPDRLMDTGQQLLAKETWCMELGRSKHQVSFVSCVRVKKGGQTPLRGRLFGVFNCSRTNNAFDAAYTFGLHRTSFAPRCAMWWRLTRRAFLCTSYLCRRADKTRLIPFLYSWRRGIAPILLLRCVSCCRRSLRGVNSVIRRTQWLRLVGGTVTI